LDPDGNGDGESALETVPDPVSMVVGALLIWPLATACRWNARQ